MIEIKFVAIESSPEKPDVPNKIRGYPVTEEEMKALILIASKTRLNKMVADKKIYQKKALAVDEYLKVLDEVIDYSFKILKIRTRVRL